MNFMRSLKTKGLLDKDIHGSVVDIFIQLELPRLVTDEVSSCVRRRFAPGDFVRVHLRNLKGKYWEGTVIKDSGEETIKVISGKFIEAREVERERIEFAP